MSQLPFHEQLAYFRDVANTGNKRIQYDDSGVAREVWLRSADLRDTHNEYFINTSGAKAITNANHAYAFYPVMCI